MLGVEQVNYLQYFCVVFLVRLCPIFKHCIDKDRHKKSLLGIYTRGGGVKLFINLKRYKGLKECSF